LRKARELCSPSSFGRTRADLRKSLVQGALAISLEVQGNVSEARGFQTIGDGGGHFRREGAGHFVGRDFHAPKFVVESHAELAESKRAQRRFATLDEAKPLGRDFRAIRQARSETSGGGPVPRGQTCAAREKANFGFAQSGVEKRRQDPVLGCGAMAGAKIERVIRVYAVGDGGKTSCPR